MSGNITFSMIKPDAVAKGYIGPILTKVSEAGFQIVSMKYTRLSREQAEAFYGVHRERGFFADLVKFMSSGPIVAFVVKKDNAVVDFRTLIGATDPKKAAEGTIRQLFADSIEANAVHGSDSDENAAIEASFFFPAMDRFEAEVQPAKAFTVCAK